MKLAVSAVIALVLSPLAEAHYVRAKNGHEKKERAEHKHHVSPKKERGGEPKHHQEGNNGKFAPTPYANDPMRPTPMNGDCADDAVWFDSYGDHCAA